MKQRPLFPNGYKSSWYRKIAEIRGMSFKDFTKEVKREHKHLEYLAFPDEMNDVAKVWRDKNPDKCHVYYAKRWQNNKESEYKRTNTWLREHPIKQKQYSISYRDKHPEKYKEHKRSDYKKHSEKRKLSIMVWQKNNPHKLTNYRHNRRFLVSRKNGATDCSGKIETLCRDKFCHWCCVLITNKNRSVDHVIPLARGGKHIPDNLVTACRSCNSSKGDKLLEEWTWKLHEEEAA